jgi:hypothetical protein
MVFDENMHKARLAGGCRAIPWPVRVPSGKHDEIVGT